MFAYLLFWIIPAHSDKGTTCLLRHTLKCVSQGPSVDCKRISSREQKSYILSNSKAPSMPTQLQTYCSTFHFELTPKFLASMLKRTTYTNNGLSSCTSLASTAGMHLHYLTRTRPNNYDFLTHRKQKNRNALPTVAN